MYALGINSAYHESSACLVRDGDVVAAVEEERFTRRKHAKCAKVDNPDEMPVRAIQHCLDTAGIKPSQIDRIGYSLNPKLRLMNSVTAEPAREGDWGTKSGEELFNRHLLNVPFRLCELGLEAPLVWHEHHLCHAASTFLVSPFEEAAILTIDGIGETASTALAHGKGTHIERLSTIEHPASLGFLWERFSMYLGFGEYDACKVMGLASYGDPSRFRAMMDGLVQLLPTGGFRINNEITRFRLPDDEIMRAHFGIAARRRDEPITAVHHDLAASLQDITDRVVVHLCKHLHERTGLSRLCLSGGVALNCVTNRVVLERTPFTELFVPPAPHDAGTALGAALLLWTVSGGERRYTMTDAYLGPTFTDEQIRAELDRRGLRYRRSERIEEEVAELLSQGAIVGWFQGGMEFGPRALGNRSLLADSRNPGMRDVLNIKVKHRELFRPFAPSVLAEHADEWFELPACRGPAEFMLLAVPARESVRDRIPAVVHVDGSSRVQTVRRETNPRYYDLISAFHARTGVPVVLNTSFNDDEPIVCTPRDAVDTFLKTQIDRLAIGDFLAERPAV